MTVVVEAHPDHSGWETGDQQFYPIKCVAASIEGEESSWSYKTGEGAAAKTAHNVAFEYSKPGPALRGKTNNPQLCFV